MLFLALAYSVEPVRAIFTAERAQRSDHPPHQSGIKQSNHNKNDTGTSTTGEKAVEV
jgi:hypothetical protein